MTRMIWIDLTKLLPKGRRPVLLYHPDFDCRQFPRHPFVVSNIAFARKNAILLGYTHWAPIPYPLPRRKKA